MRLTRVTTWPTAGRLTDLRDELDRLFKAPVQHASEFLGWTPAFDVYEEKDNFIVKAELPGMKKEAINVSFQDESLTISGERPEETRNEGTEIYRAERFFGKFSRVVTLPAAVAADKAKAQYQDGILTVTLPKSEAAKPKHIAVSVN